MKNVYNYLRKVIWIITMFNMVAPHMVNGAATTGWLTLLLSSAIAGYPPEGGENPWGTLEFFH